MKNLLKHWALMVIIAVFIGTFAVPVAAKAPPAPERADLKELFDLKRGVKLAGYDEAYLETVLNKNFNQDRVDEQWELVDGYEGTYAEDHENDYDPWQAFTKEELIEDLDYLIDLLKEVSLDYERVGGDDAFKRFRKKVIKDLEEREPNGLVGLDLERAIARWIYFLKNNHFWFGAYASGPLDNRIRFIERYGDYPDDYRWMYYQAHFMCQNLTFQKVGKDYVCYENNLKLNVDQATEDDIEIVPCWTDNFELIYRLHYFGRTAKDRPQTVVFKGKKKTEVAPVWVMTDLMGIDMAAAGYPVGELKTINDVPYVNMCDLAFDEDDEKLYKKYEKMGKKMGKAKLGIIDLRNNEGGYEDYIQHFIAGLTGEDYTKIHNTQIYVSSEMPDNYVVERDKSKPRRFDHYKHKLYLTIGNEEMYELPGLIVVLVNSNVASAGDLAVDYLKHLSNSLIVGDASNGVIVSSGGLPYLLPNTKMMFMIPDDHRIWDPEYYEEGRGFEPDIWMMSDYLDLRHLADYMKALTKGR